MRNQRQLTSELKEAYRMALKVYFGRSDVTGIDIGFRYEEGQRTDTLIVRVHTKPGTAPEAVLKSWPEDLPSIEVITAEYASEAQPMAVLPLGRDDRHDPLRPGISIGPRNGRRGTLGLLVLDETGKEAILSAAHILASGGSNIAQPFPGPSSGNVIARLGRNQLQGVDAAVARLNSSRKRDPRQFGSDVVVSGVRRVTWGDKLQKSALSTGVETGLVDGIGQYKYRVSGAVVAVEGFRAVPEVPGPEISAPGDSGAVWYHLGGHEGAGLHVAGETNPDPDAEFAIASHLDLLPQALGIRLPDFAGQGDVFGTRK
jgi:hypothetical protein